jgi:hypothetical protein
MLDDFGSKKNSIDYMELIKYVPNFILPKRYWNLKEAIKGGDFKVAFEGREKIQLAIITYLIGVWLKSHQQMDTEQLIV